MPETIGSTPLVAIVEPGKTYQQISTALDKQSDFEPVVLLETLNGWEKELQKLQPKIILIDSTIDDQPTIELIDDISLQFPESAIVAILPDDNPLNAQKAMLAGARAFILQPFSQVTLLSSLRRVRDLEARRSVTQIVKTGEVPQETDSVKVLSVYSPRGGAGCSTVALNLSLALHSQIESRVLLFEGKHLFGHLGLMLNIRANNDITDLIPHAGALDTGLVQDVVVKHASGIDVLLSPMDLEAAQGIRPDDLMNILRGVRRMYDFIVIDAGSFLNENTVTLMDLSDKILLITTPDLAALQDVSRFIHIARSLSYPPEKILTVLNRSDMMGSVRTKDIEAALQHEIFAQIPDGNSEVLRSLNQGVPLLYKYPRSRVSRSIRKIATMITEKDIKDKARKDQRSPSLSLFSQFRRSSSRTG